MTARRGGGARAWRMLLAAASLALALVPSPGRALGKCDCLKCIAGAIAYDETLANEMGEFIKFWPGYRAQQYDYQVKTQGRSPADVTDELDRQFADNLQFIENKAVEAMFGKDPDPATLTQCATMATLRTDRRTCQIDPAAQDRARSSAPCQEIYLAGLAHELSHVSRCRKYSYPAGIVEHDELAYLMEETEAYQVEAHALAILYQRTSGQCPASYPTRALGKQQEMEEAQKLLDEALQYRASFGPQFSGPALPAQ